jgi:hypothetical protein
MPVYSNKRIRHRPGKYYGRRVAETYFLPPRTEITTEGMGVLTAGDDGLTVTLTKSIERGWKMQPGVNEAYTLDGRPHKNGTFTINSPTASFVQRTAKGWGEGKW